MGSSVLGKGTKRGHLVLAVAVNLEHGLHIRRASSVPPPLTTIVEKFAGFEASLRRRGLECVSTHRRGDVLQWIYRKRLEEPSVVLHTHARLGERVKMVH